MINTEASVFEIKNLSELSCKYKLFKIVGLNPDREGFDINIQVLIQSLSSYSKSPCINIKIDEEYFIAQPEKYPNVPKTFSVLKNEKVSLEKQDQLRDLDFTSLTEDNIHLANRFLKFELQKYIGENPNIWQPKAGAPFFNKSPDPNFTKCSDNIDLYRGFQCRLIPLSNNKLGIAVDSVTKYLSREPLPKNITREEFHRCYRNAKAIYEYGDRWWYEIKLIELDNKSVSEKMLDNGKSLLETINEQYKDKVKSKLYTKLTPDCSVLSYLTTLTQRRNVASVLCRLTYHTKDVRGAHRFSIDKPEYKRRRLLNISKDYLDGFMFNGVEVKVSKYPIKIKSCSSLRIPILEFGNKKLLDFSKIDEKDFCRLKEHTLFSEEAGFYEKKDFDKQYIVIPRSVNTTYGSVLISEIKREVNSIYKRQREYDPEIVVYDDSETHSYIKTGRKIIDTVKSVCNLPGKAIVMIPRFKSKLMKKEDKLGNLVIQELSKLNIVVSIIHTDTAENFFRLASVNNQSKWQLINGSDLRRRYNGYLKNVVINKVILLNEITPFILHERLSADLVISIDVKNNNAGISLVNYNGSITDFDTHQSRWKEQLNQGQIRQLILKIVSKYHAITNEEIRNILFMRDGRLFNQEKAGILKAIEELVKTGNVHSDCKATFLEVLKTSMAPIRLFSVKHNHTTHDETVRNPKNGTYLRMGYDAYVITTGYPFYHKGTSVPLHIIYHGGGLDFKSALQDVFSLTHLTWTKIDSCSRVPLPIKFGDLRLREEAGEYDSDALELNIDENEVKNE